MKFTINVDRDVLNHLNRAHQTEAQLWLYLPDSKGAECFPVIIPREQTADESWWEAPLAHYTKLSLSQAKRITALENVERRFKELCRLAGGESSLLGLVMSAKTTNHNVTNKDDTNTDQSTDKDTTYRSSFFRRNKR